MNIEIVEIQTGNTYYPLAYEIRIDGRFFQAPVERSAAERIKSRLVNDPEYLQEALREISNFEELQTARKNFDYDALTTDVRNAYKCGQYNSLIEAAADIISKRNLQGIVSVELTAWAAAE